MDEVKRYVNLTFIVGTMVVAWLFVNITKVLLGMLNVKDIPLLGENVKSSTICGIVLAIFAVVMLWRNARVYNWALNVAYEMKKVAWPTMDETKYAMKVVIATSVIVALILFCFDNIARELTAAILRIK